MLRQLALDRRLRRKVTKAMIKKRRAKSRNETQTSSISVVIEDYDDDSWTSADSEEDSDDDLGTEDSEESRNSRVNHMKAMVTTTSDKDMAERFQNMKKNKNGHCIPEAEVMRIPDWNYLRKRLISAKVNEYVEQNQVKVDGNCFTIVRKIGDGGFSNVYHVLNEKRQHFALKLVNLLKMDGYTDKTLMNEIELLTILKESESVVGLHFWKHVQTKKIDLLYMIMDLGEAELFGILEEHKKQKDLTVNKIRFFWEEILQCISAVHDKNIIHADVKPENFIRVAGQLKIIDFGLARRLDSSDDKVISPRPLPGSFLYVAPENFRQIKQNGELFSDSDSDDEDADGTHYELTLKADIWSIGIILYSMVYNGQHPYSMVAGGRASKIFALKSFTEIQLPTPTFETNISHQLLKSLELSLKKDPKARIDSDKLLKLL